MNSNMKHIRPFFNDNTYERALKMFHSSFSCNSRENIETYEKLVDNCINIQLKQFCHHVDTSSRMDKKYLNYNYYVLNEIIKYRNKNIIQLAPHERIEVLRSIHNEYDNIISNIQEFSTNKKDNELNNLERAGITLYNFLMVNNLLKHFNFDIIHNNHLPDYSHVF